MLGLDHSSLAQHVGIDRRFPQCGEPFQADDIEFLAENIGEPALGHAAMQRHLAAFEAADHARTGPRTLSLMASGRSLAHSRAHAAPYPLALLGGLLRCVNIR